MRLGTLWIQVLVLASVAFLNFITIGYLDTSFRQLGQCIPMHLVIWLELAPVGTLDLVSPSDLFMCLGPVLFGYGYKFLILTMPPPLLLHREGRGKTR